MDHRVQTLSRGTSRESNSQPQAPKARYLHQKYYLYCFGQTFPTNLVVSKRTEANIQCAAYWQLHLSLLQQGPCCINGHTFNYATNLESSERPGMQRGAFQSRENAYAIILP